MAGRRYDLFYQDRLFVQTDRPLLALGWESAGEWFRVCDRNLCSFDTPCPPCTKHYRITKDEPLIPVAQQWEGICEWEMILRDGGYLDNALDSHAPTAPDPFDGFGLVDLTPRLWRGTEMAVAP